MENIILSLALSSHLGFTGHYNTIHPHIYYTNDRYIAGAYYNSVEEISFYVGKRYSKNNAGIEAGLVTGYGLPVIPYIRATYDLNDNISIFGTPAFENFNELSVGLVMGLEFKFKP